MKRTLVLAALAVALPTCGALAQSVVDIPSRQGAWTRDGEADHPPPLRPSRDRMAQSDERAEGSRDRAVEPQEDGDGAPPPARGARFHIENGQSRIDLRCPDGEAMRECADVLLQVLDRMQAKPSQEEKPWREERSYRPRSE